MAGRHAGIFRPPDERNVREGIGVAANKGARAADQALDDGVEQARRADRQEQKAEVCGERREHTLRYARQRRRRHRGKAEKDEGGRDQEPAAKSEIGDLFKGVDKRPRQMVCPIACRGVDAEHHGYGDGGRENDRDERAWRQRGVRTSGGRTSAAPHLANFSSVFFGSADRRADAATGASFVTFTARSPIRIPPW
jgi:hypothetical protein